ncbi:MAG: rhodanese-like domain-containing protein [Lachnospiraceae bacterium]|nr:rhodanese-like domain-containing protein [Lachnospiraceae bacterium]
MKLKIISCKTLKEYLGRKDVLLLDLREKSAYDATHYAGAVWADWENLEKEVDRLLASAEEPIQWIILYCDHGNISLVSARDLAKHGYQVMSLGGGYEYCSTNNRNQNQNPYRSSSPSFRP